MEQCSIEPTRTEGSREFSPTDVGVELRSYEQSQLREYLTDVIDLYEDLELDETAQRLRSVVDDVESMGNETGTLELDRALWSDVGYALNELEDNRSQWLRTKIARRADLDIFLTGYSTSVPIGTKIAIQKGLQP